MKTHTPNLATQLRQTVENAKQKAIERQKMEREQALVKAKELFEKCKEQASEVASNGHVYLLTHFACDKEVADYLVGLLTSEGFTVNYSHDALSSVPTFYFTIGW
jgi:hypothetical protein